MKKLNSSGLVTGGLGLLVFLTPLVLPVCQGLLELANGKQVPMRCFWTARAVMIFGGLIFAIGIMQTLLQSAEARRRLSHQVVLLGLVVILTPLYLIPTCASPDMACNVATKPALLILGGLTLLVGLVGSRAPRPTFETLPAA